MTTVDRTLPAPERSGFVWAAAGQLIGWHDRQAQASTVPGSGSLQPGQVSTDLQEIIF